MAWNHLITDVLFFHLLSLDTRDFVVDSVEDCFADFAFSVMNVTLLAVVSTLSSMPSYDVFVFWMDGSCDIRLWFF